MNEEIENLKKEILEEKKIAREMSSLLRDLEKSKNSEERRMISSQIDSLKNSMKMINEQVPKKLERISIAKPLVHEEKFREVQPIDRLEKPKEGLFENIGLGEILKLERITIKRLKKKNKTVVKKKDRKPNEYIKLANKTFSEFSSNLVEKEMFKKLEIDLIQANMRFIPTTYVSIILFTTILAFIAAILIFTFFLFFNFGAMYPFITVAGEGVGSRLLKVFWILFLIPSGTFLFMYFYPSMEKKSIGNRINFELPFATIHMSAISGSMIDPSKIFSIIISTKEYPNISKEFTKLMNEINVYGYDLVSALRNVAINSPSSKLADLFNGIATTVTSGGDLQGFFEERAQSLLFEHRLDMEKSTKSAETFMDIYISVVIAAPMILMLLLMMMKISGLGIALSTSAITLIMVAGVVFVNIIFLTFLQLRQPSG
ncbi:MAG: type II secretion system F family protein [archaeon]